MFTVWPGFFEAAVWAPWVLDNFRPHLSRFAWPPSRPNLPSSYFLSTGNATVKVIRTSKSFSFACIRVYAFWLSQCSYVTQDKHTQMRSHRSNTFLSITRDYARRSPITSAEEVMYLPMCVCLSVSRITNLTVVGDFWRFFSLGIFRPPTHHF